MIGLKILLHSFTALIILYHDIQQYKTPKIPAQATEELKKAKLAEYIEQMVRKPTFPTDLEEIIRICTASYPLRAPFLRFFLHEINFLKSLLDRTTPFSDDEFIIYHTQIVQLLMDCRKLLKACKTDMVPVKCSVMPPPATSINLQGLFNYYTRSLCNSGQLLTDALANINITPLSTDAQITLAATWLCMEHKTFLEKSQSKSLAEKEYLLAQKNKENADLQEQIKTLSTEITTLRVSLRDATELNEVQKKELADKALLLAQKDKQNVELQKENSEFKKSMQTLATLRALGAIRSTTFFTPPPAVGDPSLSSTSQPKTT